MADCWALLERTRSTVVPMLLFLFALYLPRIQQIYAQSLPKIEMVMKVIPEHCLEGQTLILYCNINGLSSVSQYDVNWTKGIRDPDKGGLEMVNLDSRRTRKAMWGDPESDSITYTLKVNNVTEDDSATYVCQILYRTITFNHGSSVWDTSHISKEVKVHKTRHPLPQCTSFRTNTFYTDEDVVINCVSHHSDGVTLQWSQYSFNSFPMIISEARNTRANSLVLPADESLNGAMFKCEQFDPSEGLSCIFGPIKILPPPTKLPTTLATTTFPPTTIPTTLAKTTTVPTPLHGYQGDSSKINQTEPTEELPNSRLCPEFVYVLVPTVIAIISVIFNVYLILRLRSERHSKTVEKFCENKLCVTRQRTGDIDKDEYCSCGYMLKIPHRESSV